MKKLVRSVSTRTRQHRPTTSTTSLIDSINPSHNDLPRKSSLAGTITPAIPSNTVLYFPKCPHSTPPTPRPAYIPSVLRTEIYEPSTTTTTSTPSNAQDPEITSSREDIIPSGFDAPVVPSHDSSTLTTTTTAAEEEPRAKTFIRQYFTTPQRCLDCTLTLAHETESHLRTQSIATLRELTLRSVELSSAIRAICQLARTKNAPSPGGIDGKLSAEDIREIRKIEDEELAVKVIAEGERAQVEADVRAVWEDVRREWEGGVRGVVRGDGTGEAEERCVLVFPWEGEVEGGWGEGAAATGLSVTVKWVPFKG